jgi:hypothetical protein
METKEVEEKIFENLADEREKLKDKLKEFPKKPDYKHDKTWQSLVSKNLYAWQNYCEPQKVWCGADASIGMGAGE